MVNSNFIDDQHSQEFTANAIEQLRLLGYEDGEVVFYRAIADSKSRKFKASFPGISAKSATFNSEGFGIYFVVNGGGDKDTDVLACRAIFYEHDNSAKEQQLLLWKSLGLPEPTFQIDTGGKSIHSYWVFDEPIAVDLWKVLQTDLLNFSNADRTIKNPSRVMRLAGFKHQTTGKLSTIVSKSGARYSYNELRDLVPPTPVVKKQKPAAAKVVSISRAKSYDNASTTIPIERLLTKAHRDILGGVGEGRRDSTGLELACDLIGVEALGSIECDYNRNNYTLEIEQNARELFAAFCSGCNPPLSDRDEDRIWNSAGKRDGAPSIGDEESLKNCVRGYLKEVIGTLPEADSQRDRAADKPAEEKPDYESLAKSLGIAIVLDSDKNIGSKLVQLTMDLFQLVGDRLKLNLMTREYEHEGKPLDLDHIKSFISQNLGYDSSTENCIQAVHAIANRFAFHPVRDYLDTLNGSPLVDFEVFNNLATLFLGNSDPLANRMLAKTLIGAVARVKKPGTKVDTLTVLQGGQGFLKSTFLKVLASDSWFCDDIRDLENKDEIAKLARYWLIELAEVDYLMGRKEVESFKRFLSTTADTYRPPYGRSNIRHERTCALFATTNKSEFLKDPTGSRRYWVVRVGEKIDCAAVAKFRNLIWATAVAAYDRGDEWWLTEDEEAQRESTAGEFQEIDPWQDEIETKWANVSVMERDGLELVQVDSIFKILEVPIERWNKASRNRIGSILRNLGFENKPMWQDGKTKKFFVRTKSFIEKIGKVGKEIHIYPSLHGIHSLPISENRQVMKGKEIDVSEAEANTQQRIHPLPESLPISSPSLTHPYLSQEMDRSGRNPDIEPLSALPDPSYPSYPSIPQTLGEKITGKNNRIEVGDRVRYVGQSKQYQGSFGKVVSIDGDLYTCDFMGSTARSLSLNDLEAN